MSTPFKLRSGNKSSFKNMGSSPTKDLGHGGHAGLSQEEASKRTHGGKMSEEDKRLRSKKSASILSKLGITEVKDHIKKVMGIEKKGKRVVKKVIKKVIKKKVRDTTKKKDITIKKTRDDLFHQRYPDYPEMPEEKVDQEGNRIVPPSGKKCPEGYYRDSAGNCVLTQEGKDYLEHVKKKKEHEKRKKEKVVKLPQIEEKLQKLEPKTKTKKKESTMTKEEIEKMPKGA